MTEQPTTHIYVGDWLPERHDSPVRVVDYDEVSRTLRVEFPDGYRAIVDRPDVVTREA